MTCVPRGEGEFETDRDGAVLVPTDWRISPSVRGVLKTTLFQTRTEFWRTCTFE